MPFRFLDLPPELRNSIYREVLNPSSFRKKLPDHYTHYSFDLSIFLVNKQIYFESRSIFLQNFIFIRVETPWDEAQNHFERDGHVPLVATGAQAEGVRDWHMSVSIEAPNYGFLDRDSRKFVLLVDDLESFTRMWSYSHLSAGEQGAELNQYLNLVLRLRNPLAQNENQELPVAVQRRLLLPFGRVKALREVEVIGPHEESFEIDMRAQMAIPPESAEHCLIRGHKLKDAGNAAFKAGDPAEAIRLYVAAFEAIHIICDGRYRAIWGDAWFNRFMTEEPYKGMHGQLLRIVLRTKLVANIVKAYLDLGNWEEAHFWGERTIDLVRIAGGARENQPVLAFPAAPEMGKIYYRTGVALENMDRKEESKEYFRAALGYMPTDRLVREAFERVSPKLYLG
jgi:tetratricopeptide (TPR) repeat protein